MNEPDSPTSDSLARPSHTRCTLVSVSLRLFFTALLLAGLTGLTLGAPSVAAQVTVWRSLPSNGLNKLARTFMPKGDDLYVGGWFNLLGDYHNISDGIVRYDTSTGTWHSLPNEGLGGGVFALALDGSDLYVGGGFTTLHDHTDISDCVARYDTSTDMWHPLSNQGLSYHGLGSADVMALELDGNDLYVGGEFNILGDGTDISNHIARYDISTGTWHSLPNGGLNNFVLALLIDDNDLYMGGLFTALADGSDISDCIVRYNTLTGMWHSLPSGGLNDSVRALVLDGRDLYVGGEFTALSDGTDISDYIARYNISTGTWHSLPNKGLSSQVRSSELNSGDLYVGGWFETLGDGTDISDYIARYDTSGGMWNSLPNQGFDEYVTGLKVMGADLYVTGWFHALGDGTDISNHIVRGVSVKPSVQAPAPIPEASTLQLLGSGLAALGGYVGLRWRVGRKGMD